MSYVCVKPITLLGNNYKPGELIQDGHILPSRERALVRTGCIAAVIHAVLAQATPQEKARWEQIQHPITHTIVDRGHPKAAETDQLTCGNRKFYVQGVDEPGQLGLYTIYYVEERADV